VKVASCIYVSFFCWKTYNTVLVCSVIDSCCHRASDCFNGIEQKSVSYGARATCGLLMHINRPLTFS